MKPDELFEDNTYNLKHQRENTTHVSQKRKKKRAKENLIYSTYYFMNEFYTRTYFNPF